MNRIHHNVEQRSEPWIQLRCGKITGTGFAKTLSYLQNGNESAIRRNYRKELVQERLTNVPTEQLYVNQYMQWGKDHELEAFTAYQTMKPESVVTNIGFVELADKHIGFSPDGLVNGTGLVELKCPQLRRHMEYLADPQLLVEQYKHQGMGGMWVCNREWCDFVSYHPHAEEGKKLLVKRLYTNPLEEDYLIEGVHQFLRELETDLSELKGLLGI